MDIPAADELEWLESNSILPEFEEEDDFIIEEEIQEEKNLQPDASKSCQASKKFVRYEELEEHEASTKRRKVDENEDDSWLRHSPSNVAESDVAASGNEDFAMVEEVVEEKVLSRFPSEIDGDCMAVTGTNGDRVYVKVDEGQRTIRREECTNGLLLEPINALINRVEQDVLNKALHESSEVDIQNNSETPLVTEELWVNKYAPNSFTELLSDEHTNREVLLWLKQWDSIVFGSQIRATTEDVFSALRQHSSSQHQKLSDSRSFFSKNHTTSFVNQNVRNSVVTDKENNTCNAVSELRNKKHLAIGQPEHKVLLLCGPPGLGKTTLAHVAAKHCGYRVVEINASDERSSSTIESKILDVVQMNSVIGDSKPKCLVIDEIDGTLGEGKGAVDVILKMVAAENKSVTEKSGSAVEYQQGKAALKKKKRKAATLLRPVICICNDLYAPALRSLRQLAKVHIFTQPTTSRVVNRLKYICMKEGFKTSSTALSALAEFTECDIRSCLNTLQFLNKKKETLNFLEVSNQVVGMKDISRSVFDIWKEIFQKRTTKKGKNSPIDSNSHSDFDFMYSLISNRGEYELIMDGIHENYLRLSYHDPMMEKTVRSIDTLGVSDSLLKYIMRTQQMSLYAYQPPIVIMLKSLVAQFEKPNIEWPKSFQRFRTMLMERKDTLKNWHNKISPSLSRHLSVEYSVEDLISPLLHILSPPTLRPAALHLLTEREKNDLAQLVDTMASYSITYKNCKTEKAEKSFKYGLVSDFTDLCLDPPIEEYARFQDCQSNRFELSLPVKQVLVHEVDKQKIMRESFGKTTKHHEESDSANQVLVGRNNISAENGFKPPSSSIEENVQLKVTQNQNIASTSINSSNGVVSRTLDEVKKPVRSASNFFDRFRKGNSNGSNKSCEVLQKEATKERDSRPFLFKYNEGYTNAVKRPVKMRELLP